MYNNNIIKETLNSSLSNNWEFTQTFSIKRDMIQNWFITNFYPSVKSYCGINNVEQKALFLFWITHKAISSVYQI